MRKTKELYRLDLKHGKYIAHILDTRTNCFEKRYFIWYSKAAVLKALRADGIVCHPGNYPPFRSFTNPLVDDEENY